MIDDKMPSTQFSGREDLYKYVREARFVINVLSTRISKLEEEMANTKGNDSMKPNRIKGGKRK